MASPMAPPPLGGFSLRVQLFSPDAHTLNDRPLRAFRVVTSPEVTIRDFCKEASRIHEINYGVPLAIKKCQDDQEFDVTQTEIVGVLFENTSTIRVIQASPAAGIRDSVPPDSALRYNPGFNTNNKRPREGNSQPNGISPNGISPSSVHKQNKRQRVADPDPDLPLPSRETEHGAILQPPMREVPDSQESVVLGRNGARDVRAIIPETPPPESRRNPVTDQQPLKYKSPYNKLREESQISETGRGSPSKEAPEQSHPPRATSASYHIQRATERGVSVSTAATSPLSSDQQPQQNGVQASVKHRPFHPVRDSANGGSHSPSEDSIYENIESDGETPAAAMKKTKTNLRIRKSPKSGLQGLEWTDKFSTPPNGSRRNSHARDVPSSELPFTPNSLERQEIQRKQKQADGAGEVRRAAAEAAKQRQREADEARHAEESIEAEGLRREEEERETQAKRALVIAKAQRIESERLEKLAKDKKREEDRLEANRLKQARLAKERVHAARVEHEKKERIEEEKRESARIQQETKARIDKETKESERLEQQKAEAAEVKRLREIERLRVEQEAAAESARLLKEKQKAEALKKKKSSPLAAELSTPASKTPVRPQSSTPFIPTGKPTPRSALKSSNSSHSSSSPVATRASPSGSSKDGGNGPPNANRRVSFDKPLERYEKHTQTPILPPSSRITAVNAPKASTPRASTPKPPSSKPSTSNTSASKPTITNPPITNTPYKLTVPPPHVPLKVTPIPPPTSVAARLSTSRNGTPQRPAAVSRGPLAKVTPQVNVKTASLTPAPVSRKSVTPSGSRASKEKSKSVEPPAPIAIEVSSDDSEEDIPSKVDPVKLLNNPLRRRKLSTSSNKPSLVSREDAEDEDVEMASNLSSPRESRSPVIFNHHTPPTISTIAPLPKASQPIDDDETQSVDDSASVESSEDDQSEADKLPIKPATVQVSQSSPVLPRAKSVAKSSPPVLANKVESQKQRKMLPNHASPSTSDSGLNTQDEVDFQLTSSLYEARPQSSQTVRSTPILPLSSQPLRPSIGASLSELNARKPPLTPSATSLVNGMKRKIQEESDESSEEEDDSSSDSSDSSSASDSGGASKFILRESAVKHKNKNKKHNASFDSSSSSSASDSDSDSDEEMATSRNELAALIARSSNSQSSAKSQNSAQGVSQRSSAKSREAGRELKSKKAKRDEGFINHYSFSQVR